MFRIVKNPQSKTLQVNSVNIYLSQMIIHSTLRHIKTMLCLNIKVRHNRIKSVLMCIHFQTLIWSWIKQIQNWFWFCRHIKYFGCLFLSLHKSENSQQTEIKTRFYEKYEWYMNNLRTIKNLSNIDINKTINVGVCRSKMLKTHIITEIYRCKY